MIVAALLVGLAGCSGKTATKPEGDTGVARKSPSAVSYRLPAVRLQVTGSFILTKCENDRKGGSKVDGKSTVAIAPAVYADPDVVPTAFDANTLPARSLKKVDARIELTDIGTIKSINASSEDRTLPTVAAALKGLVQFATLGLGAGFFEGMREQPLLPEGLCNVATTKRLQQVGDWSKAIKDLKSQALTTAQDWKAAGNTRATTDELAAINARIATLEGSIGELRGKTLTLDWRQTVDLRADKLAGDSSADCMPAAGSKGLAYKVGPTAAAIQEAEWSADLVAAKKLESQMAATICLEVPANAKSDPAPTARSYEIVFRRPASVPFKVCLGDCANSGGAQPLAAGDLVVPQWGEYSVINLDTALGEDKMYGIAFDAAGRIASVQFKRSARAENIAGGVTGVLTEGAGLQKSVEHGSDDIAIADLERKKKLYELEVAVKAARDKYLQQLESDRDGGN